VLRLVKPNGSRVIHTRVTLYTSCRGVTEALCTLGFWAKQASISKPGVGVSGFRPNCDIPLESCFKGEQLCQLSQPVKTSGSGVIRKRGAFGRGVVLGGVVLIVTICHNAVTVPPRVGARWKGHVKGFPTPSSKPSTEFSCESYSGTCRFVRV
jgi:hypothetical protein